MARFASRFAKYRFTARNGRDMVLADGQRQELTRELRVKFDRLTLQEDEIKFAIRNMVHKGLPIDRDTEEHFSPRSRISGLDTFRAQEFYGWTDEEREIVEEKLRTSIHHGTDHIELVPVPTALPWPNYSTTPLEELVAIAKAIGVVDQALAYERENQNRPEVLEALSEEPVEEDVVVLDAS